MQLTCPLAAQNSRLEPCKQRFLARTSNLEAAPDTRRAELSSLRRFTGRVERTQDARRSQRCNGARTDVTEVWWNKNNPENMRSIDSVQDFVDELADSGDNLVIVDFYAKWCHACRSLFPKLCQICRDNPDLRLLKIDWDENKDVAKTLGVKVLPFFLMYRGAEGKVAEFSCSVAKVQRLRDAIAAHHAARCSLGLNPTLKEYFPDQKPSHEMDRHEITILDSTGDSVLSRSLASFDEEAEKGLEAQPVA